MGPLDCNGRECEDCQCVNSKCACADGWSGPTCSVPFCVNRTAGCSGHGDCHQSVKSITCACDLGWMGDHCEKAVCSLPCEHGGVPDAKCTMCTGCLGAWYGLNCSSWNASYPKHVLAARLDALNASAQKKLKSDLAFNPICKPGVECVGWGVNIATGAVATYQLLQLNFSKDGPSWLGYQYPAGVDVTPHENPGFGELDTAAFKTFTDFKDYQTGKWAAEAGQSGFYARSLAEVQRDVFSWQGHDVSPAVAQLPVVLYSMDSSSSSGSSSSRAGPAAAASASASLTVREDVLSVLQGLGPYDQDPLWATFFDYWGTSVAAQTRVGGLVEYDVFASTALNADHSADWLAGQGSCAFQLATGLGGSCAGQDPVWKEYRDSYATLSCLGGDPTKCSASSWAAWKSSVATAPRLVDWSAEPLSKYIADPKLSAAVDKAVKAYVAEQRAKLPAEPMPCDGKLTDPCGGHGTCASDKSCSCSHCYAGRRCSVFDYEHKSESKKLVSSTSTKLYMPVATDRVTVVHHPTPTPSVCDQLEVPFLFEDCTFGSLSKDLSCPSTPYKFPGSALRDCKLECKVASDGTVQACGVPLEFTPVSGGGVGASHSPKQTCTSGDKTSATWAPKHKHADLYGTTSKHTDVYGCIWCDGPDCPSIGRGGEDDNWWATQLTCKVEAA